MGRRSLESKRRYEERLILLRYRIELKIKRIYDKKIKRKKRKLSAYSTLPTMLPRLLLIKLLSLFR